MEKILIPTDFSGPAENAAFYAMNLAKSTNANVILCNAIKVPANAPMAAQIAWPLVDYNTLKNEVSRELDHLSKKLRRDDVSSGLPVYPSITCVSDAGPVTDVVKDLVAKEKVSMVVMGMSGTGALNRFFLGSSSRNLIDNASFPVLLIPPDAVFNGIHKIAFATDLHEQDIEVINSLAAIAFHFNAEILIAHVSGERPDDLKHQHKINAFLSDITCKINYPKIYYRHIRQQDVNQGLDWLTAHGLIDILVMVHRHNNLIANLFNRSHTQNVARHIDIPLLVYPGH